MLTPRFVIFVETAEGEIIEAFTWTRDKASGILRGEYDAREFGYEPVRVWAEPISQKVFENA